MLKAEVEAESASEGHRPQSLHHIKQQTEALIEIFTSTDLVINLVVIHRDCTDTPSGSKGHSEQREMESKRGTVNYLFSS